MSDSGLGPENTAAWSGQTHGRIADRILGELQSAQSRVLSDWKQRLDLRQSELDALGQRIRELAENMRRYTSHLSETLAREGRCLDCGDETEYVGAYAAEPENGVKAWPGGWYCPACCLEWPDSPAYEDDPAKRDLHREPPGGAGLHGIAEPGDVTDEFASPRESQ